jgi:LemA protein
MMKTLLMALGALTLFSAGSSHMLPPPADDTDVNASMAAVVKAYRQRSSLTAELLGVERHGMRRNAGLLLDARDASARVAALPDNVHALSQRTAFARLDFEQGHLELTLARLLRASDRDAGVAHDLRYLALKAELRAVEIQIAVSRARYDDIASQYNARLSAFPFGVATNVLRTPQRPVFAELEQPPLPPPARLYRNRRERLRV